MINESQQKQLSKFLTGITEVLDLTPTQIRDAKERYEAVGNWLDVQNSPLRVYQPSIYPQGSFRLGTMIKPLTDRENYDIDLVCKLENPPLGITQHELKEMIGNRLKDNADYRRMLNPKEGGKRCWTLEYADGSRFHLDILPAVPDPRRKELYEKVLEEDVFEHALRITCTENPYYRTSIDLSEWNKSNPRGYAEWFKDSMRRSFENRRRELLIENKVEEVDDWEVKTPLQRAIQILKRHRDIRFQNDQDNKPISIIITTLAAKSYNEETNVYRALINILSRMPAHIESRRGETWVVNPVNPDENFADKWQANSILESNFHNWMKQAQNDFSEIAQQKGIHNVKEQFEGIFGSSLVTEAFQNTGANVGRRAENNELKFNKDTGYVGATGLIIPKKDFHGEN